MAEFPDSSVTITAAAIAGIREAAIAARPAEACGLLFGHAGQILSATVCNNVAADRMRQFEIEPAALFAAHRRGRDGPLALIGVWHSHPNGSPTPSARDAAGISDRHWIWLIEAHGTLLAFCPHAASASGFRALALAANPSAAM